MMMATKKPTASLSLKTKKKPTLVLPSTITECTLGEAASVITTQDPSLSSKVTTLFRRVTTMPLNHSTT